MALVDVNKIHAFGDAQDALRAASRYESSTTDYVGYAVEPHYEGGDRKLAGFRVKVLDLNGFTLGYLDGEHDY